MLKYKLPPILEAKRIYSPLFKNIVTNSLADGDSYTEMLEKALFLHIEKAEDIERNLLKYVRRFGIDTTTINKELVFAGVFEGKDLYVTQEVKTVIDYLQNEIKYLRGQTRVVGILDINGALKDVEKTTGRKVLNSSFENNTLTTYLSGDVHGVEIKGTISLNQDKEG